MKSTKKQTGNPISLTPAQFESRQNQLLVVDVRGWFEYWMGHIPGSQRMKQNHILKSIPKDKPIAVTCLSGHRSAIAAQWLVSQGYQHVYNLQGGLMAWQGAGYIVQRGNQP
ncbi:rhodanese-like domain-containing protein [Oculatella sp. LEGE 06141]|uniref:rhodanese-like domain-containing protein n=1 Tax=Oculatella sp. LEGE 06141 TaxID=1828648 RepID=UPI001882F657|nr:rhodanese-like domain-containing protein [Oculatella sp. LEGE 06141]MBE9182335.1 rhodanese-like domain-containing protein [Oculatella sp. LEGE 06141]